MAKFLVGQFADKLTGAAAVDGEPKNVIMDDREYQRDRRLRFTANCKILVKLRRDLRRNSTTPKKLCNRPETLNTSTAQQTEMQSATTLSLVNKKTLASGTTSEFSYFCILGESSENY